MRARAARQVGPSLSNRPFRPSSTSISAPGWAGNTSLLRKGFQKGLQHGRLSDGAAAVLGVQANGACVFFEGDRGNLCAIHRELGVESLPMACRQFPRVVLAGSARNAHLAFTLLPHGSRAVERITAGDGVRDRGGPFFARARRTCGGTRRSRRAASAPAAGHAGRLRRLRRVGTARDRRAGTGRSHGGARPRHHPCGHAGGAGLAAGSDQPARHGRARVRHCVGAKTGPRFGRQRPGQATNELDVARVRLAVGAVPAGLPRPPVLEGFGGGDWRISGEFDGVVRAYLAARLFGNWVAYHGRGLHAIVEYLQVALAVVKMEAVRQHARAAPSSPWQIVNEAIRNADLLLVHLADVKALSRRLG